jgi:hypothetical protein
MGSEQYNPDREERFKTGLGKFVHRIFPQEELL